MSEKFDKINPHINNRRTFVFMFGVFALFFAVSTFSFFSRFPIKAQAHNQSQFQDIAKQLADPHSPEREKVALETLKNLNPNELVAVRKLWRDQLLNDKRITASHVKIFPELEKFDKYFYQKVEERFGKGKNIFSAPPRNRFINYLTN